eukprot:7002096-Prymnesium_polylepis.1
MRSTPIQGAECVDSHSHRRQTTIIHFETPDGCRYERVFGQRVGVRLCDEATAPMRRSQEWS